MEQLKAAVHFGADAVYLAGTRFGLRKRAGAFDAEAMREAVAIAHAAGVKVHVTVNALMHEGDIDGELDYEEPDASSLSGSISADSDSSVIYRLQLQLYTLGRLPDSAQEGELDGPTLSAVAKFQEENGLDVLDPSDPDSVVDAATGRMIFAS